MSETALAAERGHDSYPEPSHTGETPARETSLQELKAESGSIERLVEKEFNLHALLAWASNRISRFRRIKPDEPDEPTEEKRKDPSEKEAGSGVQSMSNVRDFNPLPTQANTSGKSSDEIFAEVGDRLRQRRKVLSLTVEEVERHTHVKAVLVEALEKGALDELPSPVQTRGILANYAAFLDLETDSILLQFADGLQARYREKAPGRPSRTRAPMNVHTSLPPWRSFIASDLLFGGGMAIILVLFAVWGISRVMTVRSTQPLLATSPSISDVLAGTALPTLVQQVTLIPAQNTSLAAAPGSAATFQLTTLGANVNVQITLTSAESTYMRVTVDGKLQFEGRAELGSVYPYQAAKQIDVLVGNAAALKVMYNGRDLGLMGNFGEVIDRVYTAEGVATPTSTPPPTATSTPRITTTPSQTPTRIPTITTTPKPGG